MTNIQRIVTNLWFDTQAEEAVKFYTSIFKNSSIGKISKYNKEGFEVHKKPKGSILTIEFNLDGQEFLALNGGSDFKFNEAISLVVRCETQAEIDYYWEKLGAGGDPKSHVCGWLKDKFGLSWQVVPIMMDDMFLDPASEKAERAMKAMLQMKKLDIAELEKAYNGE